MGRHRMLKKIQLDKENQSDSSVSQGTFRSSQS